ncbi:UNVERIFIED_ORG: hypothetical protein ABIC54_001762 [Burkholderia sp. 1263]
MSSKSISIVAALIAATLATSAFADADHDYPKASVSTALPPASSANPSSSNVTTAITPVVQAPRGKTRDEVLQELIQARRAGLIPSGGADYPPSEATIARNLARLEAAPQKWATQP